MVQQWELRARFAARMAEVYGREVPAYTTLVEVSAAVNADIVERDGLDAQRLGSIDRVTAERHGEMLRLKVSDAGPGFGAEMLERFGRPYQSTKGRPGGGLGLFLVVNVVRRLGGTVVPGNRRTGGAVVTVELPLETLTIGQADHGG